jgi:lysozyme
MLNPHIQQHTRHPKSPFKWIFAIVVVVLYVWAFYTYFVGPTAFRWRALYGDPSYPEGYEIHGIDISHYQGTIDWDKLRLAMIQRCPVRFVFIKSTEGKGHLDENFKENFRLAKENGFLRGAYHFWSNKSSAKSQADYFIKNVHLEEGDLPPVLDVESFPQDASVEEFQEEILLWLQTMEKRYHVKPIIYTYYKFKERYLSDSRFNDYPYWIAHYYVDKMEYSGDWKFWQHTDAGRLPGIDAYVDLDVYNGSYYDLRRLTIGTNLPND